MLAEFCSHCMFFINWETDSWFLSSLSAQINYTYFRMRDLCKLAVRFQCGSPSSSLCKLHPGPVSKKWKPIKTQVGSLPLSGKFYHSNSYSCTMNISKAAGSLSLAALPSHTGPVLELLCHSCWQPCGRAREPCPAWVLPLGSIGSWADWSTCCSQCSGQWTLLGALGLCFKEAVERGEKIAKHGTNRNVKYCSLPLSSALVSGLAAGLKICQGEQNLAQSLGPLYVSKSILLSRQEKLKREKLKRFIWKWCLCLTLCQKHLKKIVLKVSQILARGQKIHNNF